MSGYKTLKEKTQLESNIIIEFYSEGPEGKIWGLITFLEFNKIKSVTPKEWKWAQKKRFWVTFSRRVVKWKVLLSFEMELLNFKHSYFEWCFVSNYLCHFSNHRFWQVLQDLRLPFPQNSFDLLKLDLPPDPYNFRFPPPPLIYPYLKIKTI